MLHERQLFSVYWQVLQLFEHDRHWLLIKNYPSGQEVIIKSQVEAFNKYPVLQLVHEVAEPEQALQLTSHATHWLFAFKYFPSTQLVQ